LGLSFNLLIEDSTFLNRWLRAQLAYRYPGGSKFGLFVSTQTSQVLLRNRLQSSSLITSDVINYGLLYNYQSLDDALYPHRGWVIKTEGALGQKKITVPTNATDSWKDSLANVGIQYSVNLRIENYIPIGNRLVIHSRASAASLFNNRLVRNELYRIGGLLTLRGFNENYFFSSQYGIITSEWRYFTDPSTFFCVFIDQGIVNYQVINQQETDYPTGIGVGTSFSTGTGVFSINYALGRDRNNTFDLGTSKLHLGVAARF
jgi:hemolysin activation/secretion protein